MYLSVAWKTVMQHCEKQQKKYTQVVSVRQFEWTSESRWKWEIVKRWRESLKESNTGFDNSRLSPSLYKVHLYREIGAKSLQAKSPVDHLLHG